MEIKHAVESVAGCMGKKKFKHNFYYSNKVKFHISPPKKMLKSTNIIIE
jgi:hypothetical protein